jgi:Protein of unknown function (DUF3551)
MRTIALVAVTLVVLPLSVVGARAQGAWCANYGSPAGGTNCGFHSFEQCRATVSGIGGFCQASPGGAAYGAIREPRRRSHRRD